MECPAQFVELGLQFLLIEHEAPWKSQAGEIVGFLRDGLNFHASFAEVFSGYFRLAMPAHAPGHLQLATRI
jgi:hypothetical protein